MQITTLISVSVRIGKPNGEGEGGWKGGGYSVTNFSFYSFHLEMFNKCSIYSDLRKKLRLFGSLAATGDYLLHGSETASYKFLFRLHGAG